MSDLSQIITLHETCFNELVKKTSRRISRAHLEKKIKKAIAKDIALVLEEKREIAAFAWGKKTRDYFGNEFGEIVAVIVRRDFQNKGFGAKLTRLLEKKLGVKDVRLYVLEVNPAKKLYKKLGYKPFLNCFRKTR